MSTYEEIAAKLRSICDARVERYIQSGLTTKEFQAIPENFDEFREMFELSGQLLDLEATRKSK